MLSIVSIAQNESSDFKKTMKIANSKYDAGDFNGASKIYNKLYLTDSLDKELNFKLGVCNFNLKKYDLAEDNFSKSSSAISLEIFRYKAAIAHFNQKFKKAINYYNGYKIIAGNKDFTNDEINVEIDKILFAEQAMKNPRNVSIINIGDSINTQYDEYVPLITADDQTLFFTSRRPGSTGGLLDPNDQPFEDIYVSHKDNYGNWLPPQQLPKGINSATNDACAGLSADGQTLFIFRTNPDMISGDLYKCKMGLDDWEAPKKLGSDINSSYIESSASITVDDRVLYFSSDREGGFGGKDIYKVVRLPNGEWSKAINLGPTINTKYNEDAPFISSDRKTLYFSSQGHQNMGGYDIFKSEIQDNIWSNPINVGYPINTVNDDIFFVLAADGKSGYYSSSMGGGKGGQDIYKIILKDEFVKLHVLKGKVYADKNNTLPISAKITLIENESKKIQGIYKAKDVTGSFILLVEPEKTYNVLVESDGYYPLTKELEFNINSDKELVFNLDAKKGKKEDK